MTAYCYAWEGGRTPRLLSPKALRGMAGTPAVWPVAGTLTSLCLGFPLCKIGIIYLLIDCRGSKTYRFLYMPPTWKLEERLIVPATTTVISTVIMALRFQSHL